MQGSPDGGDSTHMSGSPYKEPIRAGGTSSARRAERTEMSDADHRVLIVDDEAQIRQFLRAGFELGGYHVDEAVNGTEGIREITLHPYDLVILDLSLPDIDGSEVLERIRAWSTVPVIILSVRAGEAEKVKLLELGADDYVVKPFFMSELLARAKVALRRQIERKDGESILKLDRLVIDFAARTVLLDGERLNLTPKEYRLLQVLAQDPGKVITHQSLLKSVWGQSHVNSPQYLRIFMRKLRQKIEVDPNRPKILLTELGVGYRLNDPRAAEQGRAQ
jgi:two-component system, OmpR family, KDP operon response regulator KdpE